MVVFVGLPIVLLLMMMGLASLERRIFARDAIVGVRRQPSRAADNDSEKSPTGREVAAA